ncbi:MAG: PEP-CTERM sorting domain-containing protein [Pseudomonadota bacterium]
MANRRHPLLRYLAISFACASAVSVQRADAISIVFDYAYDTRGFFTDEVSGEPIEERRAVLDQAASFYAGFLDQLALIAPQSGDSWSVSFGHPSLDGGSITITDETIAADSLRVFVGGSPSAPGVLGFADNGFNLMATGSDDFVSSVENRGQDPVVDFAPWGGRIWFNASANWYFGADEAGLQEGQNDFLTTAIHELAHILGFGSAPTWNDNVDADGFFVGLASLDAFGAPVPLDQFEAHWAEGVMSDVRGVPQETLMDPSTPAGTRQLLTTLDYAGLADIGWQPAAVPLPSPLILLASALGVALTTRRRHPLPIPHASGV